MPGDGTNSGSAELEYEPGVLRVLPSKDETRRFYNTMRRPTRFAKSRNAARRRLATLTK